MRLIFTLVFLFIFTAESISQDLEYSAEINASGLIYTQDESPFWLHSNQRGRIDELTNFSGWISANATYGLGTRAFMEIGLGGLYQDGYTDKFQLDESYLSFQNSWLEITAGRKQKNELYRGISASNENILWSLNARPLPGIQIKTKKPVFISGSKGIGFTAALEEYLMDDARYVEDTRLHHKRFSLVYRHSERFEFSAGLQHFVQWGGVHPEFGQLPDSFSDYLDVFMGKEGEDTVGGQEANALGNHLGSYEVKLKTQVQNYKLELIYNHLFEDGSGRVLRNTPDGRYGIYLEDQNPGKLVEAVIYEFYYTKNQSENSPSTDWIDNYFNNNLYRSGWTYESRILGVPFIGLDENRFRINNNKLIAHHLGITGLAFDTLPYKFLGSYRKNYGAKAGGNIPQHDILSTYIDVKVYSNIFDVNLQLGADFNTMKSPNYGAGIILSASLL
ncbi:MAG TPA: capsule assembly Wzi family protein [Salegentibacter sp.]|uniref:capsule assembly Wzi family protein n=1 Tax=Salegentibacter sp. TaxID=1903072 RepID=UPI002F926D24